MVWNLQSYPTRVFTKRMWHFRGSTHTLTPPAYFQRVRTPKATERRINSLDQWCLRRILNITWSEHVTNSEIRRRTGQPLLSDIVRARRLQLFGHVARADKSQDHSRALSACIWHSPKNWKRRLGRPRHYLAENGGGRPASIQPRSCIRVQEGIGENYLARTHGNGYVTDKPRMMMMTGPPAPMGHRTWALCRYM